MSIEDESLKVITDSAGKLIPEIYADIAQPSARHIGSALETLFKVGLSPIKMLDWGFEQSAEWLRNNIARRLEEIPEQYRNVPPNNISVPVITNIAMTSEQPELRNLYAELLLKAMDSRTSNLVHPSYVTLISQLSPEEALIFVSFREKTESTLFDEKFESVAYSNYVSIEEQFDSYCLSLGFENKKRAQVWLDNLQRLGLLRIESSSESYIGQQIWEGETPRVDTIEYRSLFITEFGRTFLDACTPPNSSGLNCS